MGGDIPGLTINNFAIYYIPLIIVFLILWVMLSRWGLKKNSSEKFWLCLVLIAILVPYIMYLPLYERPYRTSADSIYIMAFVQSIAEGNFLKDVCYNGYPTYYPPLYFLLLGVLMWLSKASFVEFFTYIPILNILLICSLAYFVGKYIKDKKTGILYILMLFFIGAPGIAYMTDGMRQAAGMHAAVVIPHEVIAVILLVLAIYIYSREEKHDKWWAGLVGGIVALLSINFAVYYALSLILYAISRTIKTRNYTSHISRLIATGFIAFLVSSIYIVPYLLSAIKHGSDNYHLIWTTLSNFDPYLVTFGMGFMGLTFMLGILGIITLPKSNFKLILIVTLVVLFLGRLHVYITKPFFNVSYIPDHAYYAIVFFLSFTGAVFLRDFPVKISFKKCTLETLKIGHIFLISTFFLPILLWNPVTNWTIYNSFNPIPEKIESITSLVKEKTDKDNVILASKEISPWLLLLTGRHLALSGSPWSSNPTARYSLRYKDFVESFSTDDIEVVKNNLNKWNVDVIVLVKEDNKWIFRASSPEFGKFFKYYAKSIEVDKVVFNNILDFEKLYEDDFYVVFRYISM